MLISKVELAGLIRLAEARMSSTLTDVLTGSASQIADRVFDALLPKLEGIVAQAAQAAEPTLRTVANEEIVPKLSIALGSSVIVAGIIAGFIGSFFASRSRRG